MTFVGGGKIAFGGNHIQCGLRGMSWCAPEADLAARESDLVVKTEAITRAHQTGAELSMRVTRLPTSPIGTGWHDPIRQRALVLLSRVTELGEGTFRGGSGRFRRGSNTMRAIVVDRRENVRIAGLREAAFSRCVFFWCEFQHVTASSSD